MTTQRLQMEIKNNRPSRTGINFFGKILASATHEIKNNLAIINENAGLMEDLSLMAQKGASLSPERVATTSQRIIAQIKRADQVLKRMNQFSHSVDSIKKLVDLEKTVLFVRELGSRLLEMQGVRVNITPPKSPVLISTNLFFLEHLIWEAIETCLETGMEGKQIDISFKDTDSKPSIWFKLEGVEKKPTPRIESQENRELMAELNIALEKDTAKNGDNGDSGFGLLWQNPGKIV